MLKRGVNIASVDNKVWTPLNEAIQEDHVEIVRELLNNGAPVEFKNKDGCTHLNTAALKGQVDVVRELLKNDANVDCVNKKWIHTSQHSSI